MKTYNVTDIQFCDTSREIQTSEDDFEVVKYYSANIVINDSFIIQVSGNESEANEPTIPASVEASWVNEDKQDAAHEEYDIDEIERQIEGHGFKNNFNYLEENQSV